MNYSNKNILNIIQCSELGGMEHANLSLLKGLQKKKYVIDYYSISKMGEMSKLLDKLDIPYHSFGYHKFLSYFKFQKILKYFRKKKYQTIILTGHNLLITIILLLVNSKKKIFTTHFHHFENKSIINLLKWKFHYFFIYKTFDHIIFPSKFIQNEAVSIYPSLIKKSSIIYYGYNLKKKSEMKSKKIARKNLLIPLNGIIIGNAGWIIKRKRFDIFIKVAFKLLKKNKNFFFLIAGDGPLLEEIKDRVNEYKFQNSFKFLGKQTDLNDFYSSLDLFLFNSDFDALPRAPMEALTYGVPIVISLKNSGLFEFFPQKDFKYIFNNHDINKLSSSIEKIFDSKFEYQKLVKQYNSKIEQILSEETYIDSYESLFE